MYSPRKAGPDDTDGIRKIACIIRRGKNKIFFKNPLALRVVFLIYYALVRLRGRAGP